MIEDPLQPSRRPEAVCNVAGGVFYDQQLLAGTGPLWLYALLFLFGWLGRTLAAGLIVRFIEPGAQRLRSLVH